MSHSSNFSTLIIILLLYVEAHTFILETLEKLGIFLSYNACSTIIHALITCKLDYCNSLLYNLSMHKTEKILRAILKFPRREYITPVKKTYIDSKFRKSVKTILFTQQYGC